MLAYLWCLEKTLTSQRSQQDLSDSRYPASEVKRPGECGESWTPWSVWLGEIRGELQSSVRLSSLWRSVVSALRCETGHETAFVLPLLSRGSLTHAADFRRWAARFQSKTLRVSEVNKLTEVQFTFVQRLNKCDRLLTLTVWKCFCFPKLTLSLIKEPWRLKIFFLNFHSNFFNKVCPSVNEVPDLLSLWRCTENSFWKTAKSMKTL